MLSSPFTHRARPHRPDPDETGCHHHAATRTIPPARQDPPLLQVEALDVIFDTHRGPHQVLHQVSFCVAPGEILGVVGESGAGKSLTGLAVMGLIDPPGRVAQGRISLNGERIDACGARPCAACAAAASPWCFRIRSPA